MSIPSLSEIIDNVGSWLGAAATTASNTVSDVIQSIQDAAIKAGQELLGPWAGLGYYPEAVQQAYQAILDAKDKAQQAVVNFFSGGPGGPSGVSGLLKSVNDAVNGVLGSIYPTLTGSGGSTGGTGDNTNPQSGIIGDIENFISSIVGDIENEFQSILDAIKGDIPSLSDIETFFTTTIPTWAEGGFGYVSDHLFTPVKDYVFKIADTLKFYLFGVGEGPGGVNWSTGGEGPLQFTTRGDIDALIQNVQRVATAPKGILEALMSVVLRVAVAVTSIGAALEPLLSEIRQEGNVNNPTEQLPPATLVDMQYKGLVGVGNAETAAARQGVAPEDYQLMFAAGSYTPSPDEAASWLARGFITEATYNKYLADNHSLGTTSDNIRLASIRPASTQSHITASGRVAAGGGGFLAATFGGQVPQGVTDLYRLNQVDASQASDDWKNHWSIPGPEWFAQASFRGLRPATDVQGAALAYNYPPEIAQLFIDLSRPVVPVRVTTTLFSKAVIDEAQARANYAKLGYAPADIDTLVAYAESLKKKTDAQVHGELSKLALSDAEGLYHDGVFTADQLKEVYQEHGYSDTAAGLAVERLALKDAATERKAAAQEIVDSVAAGLYDQATGIDNLIRLGYTQREVLKYSKAMGKARTSRVKVPTSGEIKNMFKDGFIQEQDVIDYYTDQGYADKWIAPLVALIVSPPPKPSGSSA